MHNNKVLQAVVAVVLLVFAGSAASAPEGSVGKCTACGTVRHVDLMNKSGKSSGAGVLIGAVVGGVVGHQFGGGRGQDAATAGGAVAGGMAGNQVEKNRNTGSYYRITVDMDDGETREVNVQDAGGLVKGSRVRVAGNNLEKIEG